MAESLEDKALRIATEVVAPYKAAVGAAYKADSLPQDIVDHIYTSIPELNRALMRGEVSEESVSKLTSALNAFADSKSKLDKPVVALTGIVDKVMLSYVLPGVQVQVSAVPSSPDEIYVQDLTNKVFSGAPKTIAKGKNAQPLVAYAVKETYSKVKADGDERIREAVDETQRKGATAYNGLKSLLNDAQDAKVAAEKSRKNWRNGAIGASLVALLSIGSCVALNKYGNKGTAVAPTADLFYNGKIVEAPYNTNKPVQVTQDVSGNRVATRMSDIAAAPTQPEVPVKQEGRKPPVVKDVTCYQCKDGNVVSEKFKNKCKNGWEPKAPDCKENILPPQPPVEQTKPEEEEREIEGL